MMTETRANMPYVHRCATGAVDIDFCRARATALRRKANRDAVTLWRLHAFAADAARVGRWMRLRTIAGLATLARLAVQIEERCYKRHGFLELHALDDHTLKDIGIERSEILYHVHSSGQSYRRRRL